MDAAPQIELIPIDQIEVINPRGRNKKGHGEIIDNISLIGLKRPIKVSRRPSRDGQRRYSLICGQGRIEAFQALGQEDIPAIIVDADESACLVESLVENVARRQHRAIDLMQEVGSMRRRGYSDTEIGNKIGVTSSWVCLIAGLLEKGEGRLVAAVETGLIPLSFAVEVAKVDDAEAQQALADAYEEGKIKGAKIGVVRRLLDQRARRRRAMPGGALGRKNPPRGITGDQLVKLYQKETDRQRVLVKKADYAQSRLLFVIEALRELRADEGFISILRGEQLMTMPRGLTERMGMGR